MGTTIQRAPVACARYAFAIGAKRGARRRPSRKLALGLLLLAFAMPCTSHATTIYLDDKDPAHPRYATNPDTHGAKVFLNTDEKSSGSERDTPNHASAHPRKQTRLIRLIRRVAVEERADPNLIEAVAEIESNLNPFALSHKGAMGLMQLMPHTALKYRVGNPYDDESNARAGVRQLVGLLNAYHGNLVLALCAYNAGKGAVEHHAQRIPPFRETMLYVPAVLARMHELAMAEPDQ